MFRQPHTSEAGKNIKTSFSVVIILSIQIFCLSKYLVISPTILIDGPMEVIDRQHTPLRIVIMLRGDERLLNMQDIFEIESSGAVIIMSVSFEGLVLQVTMLISFVSKKFVILLKNSLMLRIVIRFRFSRALISYFFKPHHQLNRIFGVHRKYTLSFLRLLMLAEACKVPHHNPLRSKRALLA